MTGPKDLRRTPDNPGPRSTDSRKWRVMPQRPTSQEGGEGASMDGQPSGDPALLTPTRQPKADNALARREADARFLERARSDHEVLVRLRDVLIEYALPIIESKIANGKMWNDAAEIGIPAPVPSPPVLEPEEIESLAAEVVVRAYKRFCRHGLYEWHPMGGLSLTSWFYRDCQYQFANAVRAWSTDRRVLAPSLSCLLGVEEQTLQQFRHQPAFAATTVVDPESVAISSADLECRLREIEQRLGRETRLVVEEAIVNDRPLSEVALELEISRQKAYRLIRKCRKVMIEVWGEESQS